MSNFTEDELREFDEITSGLSSPSQLARISARLEVKQFVDKHGKDKCDAMFKVLQERDATHDHP